MPKAKPKASTSGLKGIDPKELDAFRSELEGLDAEMPADEEADDSGVSAKVIDRSPSRKSNISVTVEEDEGLHQPEDEPKPGKPEPVSDGGLGGKPPPKNMQKLERGKGRRFPWAWAIGILTVLVAVAVVGFFVFNRAQRFSGEGVKLDLSLPTEAASGSSVTLTVRYFNDEPVDLVRAELNLEYPDGFTVTDASLAATNDLKSNFNLGTVKRGRASSVTITGQLLGQVGSDFQFSALMTYRPSNFSSDFQTRASTSVKISSSLLSVTLDGPAQLAPDASGTWTIQYANAADRDLENVRIEAVYPSGFEPTKVDPAASERNAIWEFETIERGAEGTITISGTISGTVGDSAELLVRAGFVENGQTKPQTEQRLLIFLVSSGVSVTVAANGQAGDTTVEAGDELSYTVKVANDSELELHDVTVTATLSGAGYADGSLAAQTKGSLEGDVLTWTKNDVPSLELLKPNGDVQFRFTAEAGQNLIVESDADVNPLVTVRIAVTSSDLPSGEQAPKPVEHSTKVATQMKLTGEARFTDDDGTVVGEGPVPPVAGQTTVYRMRWTLTNTTSDVENVTVKTTLPIGVLWTGKNVSRDAGDVGFDAATRTITWTLNKLPAGTGDRLAALHAEFEISITPTADQVGSVVVLSDTVTAAGKDSHTELPRESKQTSLTSDIPNDATYPNQGTVQPAS